MKVAIVEPSGEVHEHEVGPGLECPACHRTVPKEKADSAPATGKRQRVTFTVPPGEEGLIEELEILVVEKHGQAWPSDLRAMRDGVGLDVIGSSNWRFRVHHFALYATLNVPELAPVEEGP